MMLMEYPEKEICDVIFLSKTSNKDVFDMTQKAINSLHDSETNNKFRVIVVESNLDQNTPQYENVSLCLNYGDQDFSYNKALNLAFNYIESDYVAVFNNDVLFMENWYSIIRYYMDVFCLDCASPRCPVVQNGIKPEAQSEILSFPEGCVVPGFRTVVHFCGWGWITKRDCLQNLIQLDAFPEDLTFWFQDDHIARVMQSNHKKHGLVTSSHVIHFGQQSYKLIPQNQFNDMTSGLYELFVKKWIQ